MRRLAILIAILLFAAGCGGDEETSPLADLRIVGVDFGLDSIVLNNVGGESVRTEGLWVYQDGEASRFNIFNIAPRAPILFRVDQVGGLDPSGGEITLFSSESFADPESIVDYVAWGRGGHSRSDVAVEALLWSEDDTVDTRSDTVLLTRVDEAAFGSIAWEASSELP